jgi:hypothetical protein
LESEQQHGIAEVEFGRSVTIRVSSFSIHPTATAAGANFISLGTRPLRQVIFTDAMVNISKPPIQCQKCMSKEDEGMKKVMTDA